MCTLKLHRSSVRDLIFSPPPAPNAPFVLVSVGDQIGWWNISYVLEHRVERQRRKSGARQSRGSRSSRPENLTGLAEGLGNMGLLNDSKWANKRGQDARPDLLCSIKLAGDHAATISVSPTFTSFVTIDSSGLMYIMKVL